MSLKKGWTEVYTPILTYPRIHKHKSLWRIVSWQLCFLYQFWEVKLFNNYAVHNASKLGIAPITPCIQNAFLHGSKTSLHRLYHRISSHQGDRGLCMWGLAWSQ